MGRISVNSGGGYWFFSVYLLSLPACIANNLLDCLQSQVGLSRPCGECWLVLLSAHHWSLGKWRQNQCLKARGATGADCKSCRVQKSIHWSPPTTSVWLRSNTFTTTSSRLTFHIKMSPPPVIIFLQLHNRSLCYVSQEAKKKQQDPCQLSARYSTIPILSPKKLTLHNWKERRMRFGWIFRDYQRSFAWESTQDISLHCETMKGERREEELTLFC